MWFFLQMWIGIVCVTQGGAEKKETDVEKEVREYIELANQSIYTDPSKAVSYSHNAILKAERSTNKNLLCNALVSLGRSYVNLGSFDMGFEAYYNAWDNCPPEDKALQAYISVFIGNLYRSLGDVKKAFQFIDRATEIYTELNDTAGMANCYNTLGLVYERIEADDKAERYLKKALALNRLLGDQKNIAKNLNNLAMLEGNPDEKIAWAEEAIRINKLHGANWSLAENYNNLATQYFYKKDYKTALEWLKTSMIMANSLSAKELICDNYRYQTWVYCGMGDYKTAYECMLNLYELEKDMLSEKKIREMELNAADRRFRMQQREMNLKQKELKIASLQKDMIMVTVIFFALFLGLAFITFRIRQRRKISMLESEQKIEEQNKEMMELKLLRTENDRKNMELELGHSRKELTNFACYLRSKNDLIEKIQGMLRESYKDAVPEVKAQLKKINAFIAQYQNKEDDWGNLALEIDRINAEFINRLTELHPNLSKNEKQLASLLRIELSTKEIALLVGSTPKAVNMARYRLRQKLEIETDEKLSEYMKKV